MDKGESSWSVMVYPNPDATILNTGRETSADRIGSWTDHPLSAEGRQDARRAAHELADYGIALVVSSDLKRGEQTAAVIARAHGADRRSSPAFRSWNLGELAGKPFTEARPVIERYATQCPLRSVPGGESFAQFRERALPAVRRILARAKVSGQPVALVSHFRVLKLVEGWIAAGCKGHEIDMKTFLQHNILPGAIIELAPQGAGWKFTVIDAGEKAKKAA